MSKTTFDSVKKVWSNSANPDEDRVPLGTFLGPAILKKLRESNADRIAEYNHDAGDLITIKQLYEGTITAAKNMQNLEIGKDDIIAIYARHNSYITKIAFACYILGVPWCPLDYVQDDLEYLLNYIKPTILIYDEEFTEKVEATLRKINVDLKFELTFGNHSTAVPVLFSYQSVTDFEAPDLSNENPDTYIACLSFTSGSTGKPKSVILSHSMFINMINSIPSDEEFVLNFFAPSGPRWMSQLYTMLIPLFTNHKRTYTRKCPDPVTICEVISKWHVNVFIGADTMLHLVIDHYNKNPFSYDLTCLRYAKCTGEAPSKVLQKRLKAMIPTLTFVREYGLTECAGVVASNSHDEFLNGGNLYKGVSVKIVDENSGEDLGTGEVGMIHLKIRVPFPGYFRNEEWNKTYYTLDEWFRTRDIGYVNDQNQLVVYCRNDFIPTVKGRMVIPNVVEEYINSHPSVEMGFLVGLPVGVGEKMLGIFIQLKQGIEKDSAKIDLEEYLKKEVDWGLVRGLYIVDQFKRNSAGIVDKEILKRDFKTVSYFMKK